MKPKYYFIFLFLWVVACGEEFDPYYQIQDIRVLGIQASPPSLLPGERSRIKPLIYNSDESEVSYQWTWCPLSSGSSDSYECSITYEELSQQLPEGLSILPYDLGQTEEIDFTYPIPSPLVDAFCEALITQSENLPDFIELPSCTYGLPIYVTLSIAKGDQTITSVKKINLATQENQTNKNPSIPKIYISSSGSADQTELTSEKRIYLHREADYDFQVEIDESSSETYIDEEGEVQEESIVVSWFVESGELESTRTGYYPNQNSLQDLKNKFKTPSFKEYNLDQLKMYVVVRDNRQGMSYQEYDLYLE
jgi:hypothetical protein